MDKEVVIFDMLWIMVEKEQVLFYDIVGKFFLEKLVVIWDVVFWYVNFIEEEVEKFEKVYLEFFKQWGKIVKELFNCDIGICIQYYYVMKWELGFKEKFKKQLKKCKKGGCVKQCFSVLVLELGNGEYEIEDVIQEIGENGECCCFFCCVVVFNFGGNEVILNVDLDGVILVVILVWRRGGIVIEGVKNDSGVEKVEGKRVWGRKQVKDKVG